MSESLLNYENTVEAAYSPNATILPPSFQGTMPNANQNFGETFPPSIPESQFQNVPTDSFEKNTERMRDNAVENGDQSQTTPTPTVSQQPVIESAQTMDSSSSSSSSSSINVNDLPFKFLFGPLPVSYCLLFYILSFFAFILFVLGIVGFIVMLIKPPKGFNWIMASTVVFGIILYFVVYLLYRMLFNMCSGNHV